MSCSFTKTKAHLQVLQLSVLVSAPVGWLGFLLVQLGVDVPGFFWAARESNSEAVAYLLVLLLTLLSVWRYF